jgi:hypothetical protein
MYKRLEPYDRREVKHGGGMWEYVRAHTVYTAVQHNAANLDSLRSI